MKSILASAEIRFFAQATEDEERVLKEISEGLRVPWERFERTVLEGHFGNPITSFLACLTGSDADRFASGLALLFDDPERDRLLREIPSQIDERGSIYLRIDKQSLLSKRPIQAQVDAVRIRLKLRFKTDPSKTIETYRALLTAGVPAEREHEA